MKKQYKFVYRKQIVVLFILVGIIFSLLFFRLFDLQIIRGSFFRAKADGNRFYTRYLPAERGVFFDRFGDPLVVNVPKYYLLEERDSLYSLRSPITHIEALREMNLGPDTVDFTIERHYLFPESTAHVLGYVGPVTAEDLEQDKALSFSSQIGKMGLEKVFDAETRGENGSITYEINALGKKQRTVSTDPGLPGQTIATSIDPFLSEVAYRALGDQRGSVVILDADTGGVLSLVSAPTFNSSVMSKTSIDAIGERTRKKKVQGYFTNPLKLFFNRSISGAYPPGSVFKIVTALSGLGKGVIDRETTVLDEGVLTVGEYSFANWYFTQHGRVEGEINVVRSLARSNDIFFYKVAEWVGPTQLAQDAKVFGFGEETGIELPGEVSGLIPDPNWKEQTLGEKWFLGNTFHMGIGQGDVLVSPLQVAAATASIAKRGTHCYPRITLDTELKDISTAGCAEQGIQEDHLDLVLEGMLDACSAGGTAYPFFQYNQQARNLELDPYDQVKLGGVACKTGTSEFGGVDSDGYRNTHAWFSLIFSVNKEMKSQAAQRTSILSDSLVATPSGTTKIDTVEESFKKSAEDYSLEELYQIWSKKMMVEYPKNIAIVILVESDEANHFKEGSKDAAPVAKAIFDWMSGKLTTVE